MGEVRLVQVRFDPGKQTGLETNRDLDEDWRENEGGDVDGALNPDELEEVLVHFFGEDFLVAGIGDGVFRRRVNVVLCEQDEETGNEVPEDVEVLGVEDASVIHVLFGEKQIVTVPNHGFDIPQNCSPQKDLWNRYHVGGNVGPDYIQQGGVVYHVFVAQNLQEEGIYSVAEETSQVVENQTGEDFRSSYGGIEGVQVGGVVGVKDGPDVNYYNSNLGY